MLEFWFSIEFWDHSTSHGNHRCQNLSHIFGLSDVCLQHSSFWKGHINGKPQIVLQFSFLSHLKPNLKSFASCSFPRLLFPWELKCAGASQLKPLCRSRNLAFSACYVSTSTEVAFLVTTRLTLSLDQMSPCGRWPCSSGCTACIDHRAAAADRGSLSVGKRDPQKKFRVPLNVYILDDEFSNTLLLRANLWIKVAQVGGSLFWKSTRPFTFITSGLLLALNMKFCIYS